MDLTELKEYILIYEKDINPFYDINPDIKITSEYLSDYKNGFTVKYKVEYVSKLDNKWRKWYDKVFKYTDGLKEKYKSQLREIKLNKILNNPDN